ncbi:MAG: aromatic amino acid lyase, partial [Methanomicrobiaceae archaeon]|nr:aromatic amino acid lyase [Methanomicrobiaceae archaeon]
ITQYTTAALVSENKSLCFPASADSIPTSMGQEDHVSMGTISARKALQIVEHVQAILGIEWMAAAQAFDLQPNTGGGEGTEAAYGLLREQVTYMKEDRAFSDDQETAAQLIACGALVEAVEKAVGSLD